MSTYEWERGTIKLPSNQYQSFRRGLIEKANSLIEADFAEAERMYALLKAESKGKRKFDFRTAFSSHQKTNSRAQYYYSFQGHDYHSIGRAILVQNDKGRTKLVKPKKKDFKKLGKSETRLSLDEASITFNPKDRTVTWQVYENNHACDTAREHPLGAAFFNALSRVTWTSKTGGTIVGNDEYHSNNYDEGGGSNYAKDRFGRDKVAFEKQMDRLRSGKRVRNLSRYL